MNAMITKFKKMSVFQKIQVLSGLIPLYSFLFVAITTYLVLAIKKRTYFSYVIQAVIYFSALFLLLNIDLHRIIQYFILVPVSLVGNFCLVCNQNKE